MKASIELPDDINPGIRRTVEFLVQHGFATCDSGDGVTHMCECDRDHAYVVMIVEDGDIVREAHRLVDVLAEAGVEVGPIGMEPTPAIQASYDPANRIGALDLTHVDDALLFGSSEAL